MSPRFSTPLNRYESKASKFNSKFESDYKDCLGMLGREKRLAWEIMAGGSATSSEDYTMPITDIPTLITAPTDAASQQDMLLRTSSTHSTSPKMMFVAPSETGAVVTPNSRRIDSPKRLEKSGRASHSSFGDDSTLPTFLSVGTNTSWQNDLRNDTMFLVSKNGVEEPPLEARSTRTNGMGDNAALDSKTRKQLHYKEKLRLLTDGLTTSSAVERSRKMLSDIMEKANTVEENILEDNDANNGNPPPPHSYKRIFDGIKNKFYACSSRLCVDEAVVIEGIIIAFPAKTFSCKCADVDDIHCTTGDYNYDGNASEVSSLTGVPYHLFQTRHWMDVP
mmetsp:Transcript_22666/g.49065  ORF Transcript_22666/g.49065 Transcript_22666/m.49065 type:complete len:335 (+) Transcript_22666:133-1137(+)|eukprot:CAMPEP_0172309136 /NCGR_PEP_ID=MMETSP1058-20130122/9514_1 /TAXON_ID=83371 /ORGANISM="Detonula confervacea, Strain CCMP 353" /LENGTH=334 /DNA_ID=CAMNT_0013021699 /DNA_START=68 /DNA_END=1072 /DNA_ORIENTATION=+